jgi:hypothetical protein
VTPNGSWYQPFQFGNAFCLNPGKTQTFSSGNFQVLISKDPFSPFASAGISVEVDPANKVTEWNEFNNKLDQWIGIPLWLCT